MLITAVKYCPGWVFLLRGVEVGCVGQGAHSMCVYACMAANVVFGLGVGGVGGWCGRMVWADGMGGWCGLMVWADGVG